MEITTIDNQVIDTAKKDDLDSMFIEQIENSGLRKMSMEHNGACMVWATWPKSKGFGAWSTFHIPDFNFLKAFVAHINNLARKATNNKLGVALVDLESFDKNP